MLLFIHDIHRDEVLNVMGPKKYTLDELSLHLDEKFSDFKTELLTQLKKEIYDLMVDQFRERDEKIEKLESEVAMLQKHVTNLKSSYENKTEDLEQYGRRLCLRIEGIPAKENETSNNVLDIVKEKMAEAEVDIPDNVLDRAHRIGRPYQEKDGTAMFQSIMVRFTTFRHRTLFFKNRKKLQGTVRIKLDLTKRRYSCLKDARNYVEKNPLVSFVYSDINCRLKIRFSNDKESFFDSLDELKSCIKGNEEA